MRREKRRPTSHLVASSHESSRREPIQIGLSDTVVSITPQGTPVGTLDIICKVGEVKPDALVEMTIIWLGDVTEVVPGVDVIVPTPELEASMVDGRPDTEVVDGMANNPQDRLSRE